MADKEVLASLCRLCKDGDKTIQYGLANLVVNLANAYDLPELTAEQEQLKKIGKFAGEAIPEPHPLDAAAVAAKRVEALLAGGFVEALVTLAKAESEVTREQVARVFLAMAAEPRHRGALIQQGGVKALLPLAHENTPVGKVKAAQALAKICISSDPNVAFGGQRAFELVRPLLALTKERKGLLQFEAGLALTNLASMNDEIRCAGARPNGARGTRLHFPPWVGWMACLGGPAGPADHGPLAPTQHAHFARGRHQPPGGPHVRRGLAHPPRRLRDALQPAVLRQNLRAVCHAAGQKVGHAQGHHPPRGLRRRRLRCVRVSCHSPPASSWAGLLTRLAWRFGAPALGRAASGCVAVLSDSKDVCERILQEKQGLLILRQNAASGDVELQMRAFHTLRNMATVRARAARAPLLVG